MPERISVKKAAELTGLSQISIREGIKSGALEFGRAIPSRSGQRFTIHISPNKLKEYLGLLEKQESPLDPLSATDAKIKFILERVEELESTVNELKIIVNSLIDNQEYIIKRMNGEKLKEYSPFYRDAIKSFRSKPIYEHEEEKVTVKRAAQLTGLSESFIRFGIINGELPFGNAIKKVTYNGKYRTIYHISMKKLAEYLGLPEDIIKGESKRNE